MKAKHYCFVLGLMASAATMSAQTPVFQLGSVYECPGAQSFKVISCSGSGDADLCDVQSYVRGQPNQRGKSTRKQVMTLLPLCHAQTPAEAQAEARGGQSRPPAAAAAQTGVGGFKVGDTVQINTAFGWMNAQVVAINGNSYRVRAQGGAEAWKTYPTELRRIGPLTAEDRAQGIYEAGEKVQVNFEGRWVDSKILTTMGQEYQVQLPGNRSAWTTAPNLRLAATPQPAAPKAGQPPKPGLTSCAGKIEGRYASSAGLGGATIVFRSGKATMSGPLAGSEEVECWMGNNKIYLHKPGEAEDLPIDINNDGTLETPFGELKKKGN